MDQQPIIPTSPIPPQQPQQQPQPFQPQESVSPAPSVQPIQPVMPVQPAAPQPVAATPAAPVPQVIGMTGQPLVQQPTPQPTVPQTDSMQPTVVKKQRKALKIVLIALLGLGILGGGTAAAYFGMVLPNKPENVLKMAVANSLQKTSTSINANVEGKADEVAYKVDFASKANTTTKASSVETKITISGVSLAVEARYVDKAAYVKVKDLDKLSGLVSAYSPQASPLLTQVSAKVNDKWFEIDSTLIKTAKLDCLLESDNTISDDNLKSLLDDYTKNPFVTIDKTSADTVNGKAATKFELTLDNKTADQYSKSLENTDQIKKINECFGEEAVSGVVGDQDITQNVKEAAVTGKTPFTIWVDKATKTITRASIQSTADQKKQGIDVKVDATMDYSEVKVDKPNGAVPITTLLAELGPILRENSVLGAQVERLIP